MKMMKDSIRFGSIVIMAVTIVVLASALTRCHWNSAQQGVQTLLPSQSLRMHSPEGLKQKERIHDQFALHCKGKGYLAIRSGGRLGNQICTYASAHALGKYYKLKPFLIPHAGGLCIETECAHLLSLFSNLTIPVHKTISKCDKKKWQDNFKEMTGKSLREAMLSSSKKYEKLQYENVWVKDEYLLESNYFKKALGDLLKTDFKTLDNTQTMHAEWLKKVFTARFSNKFGQAPSVLVGIHIRRKEYIIRFKDGKYPNGGNYLSVQYFKKGMDYFREHYTNPLFIVASDDLEWCKKYLAFDNVEFTFEPDSGGRASAELDMTFLSRFCDHSILSFGTFSLWSALLRTTKETTILYYNYAGTKQYEEWNTKSSKWIPLDDPCHVMVNHRIEWAHDKKFCNESVGSNL